MREQQSHFLMQLWRIVNGVNPLRQDKADFPLVDNSQLNYLYSITFETETELFLQICHDLIRDDVILSR